MKRTFWACVMPAALVLGLWAGTVSAQTRTISASASNGNTTAGNTIGSVPSKITCTQAYGASVGSATCSIQSPGWNGLLAVGESIGTNGPGNIRLTCQGSYSIPGSGLQCSARVEDTVCAATQSITASAGPNVSTRGSAALATSAVVRCTAASGGTFGTTCGIRSATGNTSLTVGQETFVPGPGTASISCGGQFNHPFGGLSCTAVVTQVCP